MRFRIASALELGIDRATTGILESLVGIISGPTGIVMIQLGRTLWSPISIVFTALQTTATRAIAMADHPKRSSVATRIRRRAVLAMCASYALLSALSVALPDGALHSSRAGRLLAVAVFSIYFVGLALGISARVTLRVLRRMRALVSIQAVGGVVGLGVAVASAPFLPWYVSIALGHSLTILVALAMQHATTMPTAIREVSASTIRVQ